MKLNILFSLIISLLVSCSHDKNGDSLLNESIQLESTEIKVEHAIKVCPKNVNEFINAFDLKKTIKARTTFFDTKERTYFDHGLVLRARKKGKEYDITIKQRPYSPRLGQPNSSLADEEGFKCEIDRSTASTKTACSLSTEISSKKFDKLVSGKYSIKSIFDTQLNKTFLEDFAKRNIDWNELENSKSKIHISKWKIKNAENGAFDKLVFEFWDLKRSEPIYEISTRSSLADSDATWKSLNKYINDSALTICGNQVSKTKLALAEIK
jgi:hypothetical protein